MRCVQIEVIAEPATAPVTVAEFIDHARLNGLTVDRQPELLDRELRAATTRGEQYTRRSFLTQTLSGLFVPAGDDAGQVLLLPRGKVQGVASITAAGAPVDPATYKLAWNVVTLDAALDGPATVVYDSGYGDTPADVPDGIKEGILEYAMVLYENRSGGREMKYAAMAGQGIPDGVRDLWRPFQIELSG
jgi:uncharacterized phiE125 gp8 family phage protein